VHSQEKVAKIQFLALPCLFVCLHVTTQKLLNIFSGNFLLQSSIKIFQHISILCNSNRHILLFLISMDGVRLSALGTSIINRPIVSAPDGRWVWSIWWNENWQGEPKYLEETCPSATLSIANPTRLDLGSNLGHCSGKPVTNRLSYAMAINRHFTLEPACISLRMNSKYLSK
jgi:hypothetical protein